MHSSDFRTHKGRARTAARIFVTGTLVLAGGLLSGCAQYLSRADRNGFSAGDAKSYNAAVHTIDPWPKYAFRRSMATPGVKAEQAMKQFRETAKPAASGGVAGSTTSAAGGSTTGN